MHLSFGDFWPLATPIGLVGVSIRLVAAPIRVIIVISPKLLDFGGISTERSLGLFF